MTLQELYSSMDGDYSQAIRVLRMDKLIDKHIRKLPSNEIFASLQKAGESMDPVALFESAHAIKGVCGNLGLVKLAGLASDIAEEYRPGNARRLSDGEVKQKLSQIDLLYKKAVECIGLYAQAQD